MKFQAKVVTTLMADIPLLISSEARGIGQMIEAEIAAHFHAGDVLTCLSLEFDATEQALLGKVYPPKEPVMCDSLPVVAPKPVKAR